MSVMRMTVAVAVAAAICLGLIAPAAASDELNRAKELYRSAAYDEALTILDTLPPDPDAATTIEAHEYRVFCLVALGRKDDADKAMAALITANPQYVMSEEEASPRVRTMFTEVRRSLLPTLVQRTYANAKALFDRKDPKAAAEFDRVLILLRDPDVAGNPGLADLATVATGFRDLSKALAATTAPQQPSTPASPPAASSAARTVAPAAPPVFVAPIVISQPIPIPQISEEREWDGEVEVSINASGHVIAARMTKPIHPVYDQQLIRAALSWTYKPATRDGVPTQFVKQITIHVDTRPECSERIANRCRPPATSR